MTRAATLERLARETEALAGGNGHASRPDGRYPQTITGSSNARPVLSVERFEDNPISEINLVPRYPLVTLDELENMPDPTYLVDGLLPQGGLTMLHGHPSAGKSLVALDWALSIASGASSWMGRDIRSGRVVYIAAEGRGGLKHRIAAWRTRWGTSDCEPRLQFIIGPVPLLDPSTADLVLDEIAEVVDQPDPVLVVVDTLARCTPGADENNSKDMGQAIGTLDRIRQETGCAVLFLHHNRKDSKAERGSTALRGAVDVTIALAETDGIRELEVTKARDGDTDVSLRFQLLPVGESVVLVPETPPGPGDAMPKSVRVILNAFRDIYTGAPVRAADWKEASERAGSTFHHAVADLIRRAVIKRSKGRGEYEPGAHYPDADPGGGKP